MRPGRVHAWMRCGAVAGVREDDCQCGLLTFQKGLRVGFPPHHSYSRLPRRAQITRGRHLGHPMPRRADASGTRRLGHPMPRASDASRASVSTPPPSPPCEVADATVGRSRSSMLVCIGSRVATGVCFSYRGSPSTVESRLRSTSASSSRPRGQRALWTLRTRLSICADRRRIRWRCTGGGGGGEFH